MLGLVTLQGMEIQLVHGIHLLGLRRDQEHCNATGLIMTVVGSATGGTATDTVNANALAWCYKRIRLYNFGIDGSDIRAANGYSYLGNSPLIEELKKI
jgi:hypothetical protein